MSNDVNYRQAVQRINLLKGNDGSYMQSAAARGKEIVTQDSTLAERIQEADGDLVQRAQKGDLTAYNELVNRHQRAMYGLVSRMVFNRDDVDDLVQDIFVQTYRSINRFRGQSTFSTWLHSIAVNTTIKYLKKMKSKTTMSIDDPDLGIENTLASDEDFAPAIAAEDKERKQAVRNAVEQLSEKHRIVVILHYFEDHSCEEIARILNCSVGTVWSRLHYACKKLQGQLDWLKTA